MVKPKFSEPAKSWWVCCAILCTWQFGAVTYTVAGTTQSQALPHDFHIYTPTHISQFCPNHTFFQAYQVVPMSCICQCHQRRNHSHNHMHYPMILKFWKSEWTFLVLTIFTDFQVWSVFAVNTPSTPTFALNLCCFWNFSLCSMLEVAK